jgi:hypothetical protein
MNRRYLAVLAAALTIFSLMPAAAALASATSTARLTSQPVVFPGDTTYTVEVKNTEAQLVGKTINHVSIQLPTAAANVVFRGTPPAAGNFTNVKVTKAGFTQIVTYRGGTIAPQGTQTFSIPVTVQRPARSDLSGAFVVQTSSDDGVSGKTSAVTAGGTLTTAVEALEILTGSIKPTAPTNADNSKGVTDHTATAGQTVTYTFDVKNHAKESLNITAQMTADNPVDKPGASATQSVAGNDGVATFTVPIVLGPAVTQRQTVLTASAIAPNADAAGKTDALTVQVPVNLTFSQLQPLRVTSGPNSAREFTVTAAKIGGPAFTLDSGALRFGGNVASVKNPPIDFAAGGQSRSLSYTIAEIAGNDGALAASITSAGIDNNLAGVNLSFAYPDPIVIDNIAPVFDIPLPILGNAGKDQDGDQVVAANDTISISVSGCVTGNDLDAPTLKVWLDPDAGADIPVTVSRSTTNDGLCFTGSAPTSTNRWNDAATQFTVAASIQDTATNLGTGVSPATQIDQVAPVLDRRPNAAVVESPTVIRLRFDDTSGIRGGCDRNTWSVTVNGQPRTVSEVRNGAGENCADQDGPVGTASPRNCDPTGVRKLVLSAPLGADDIPEITYAIPGNNAAAARAVGMYLLKDCAANDALRQTITAATTLIPAPPSVTNLQRRDHQTGARETLYHDTQEDRYYTNVGDSAPGADDAIKATVGGVKGGYTIEVLDGGQVIKSYPARPATAVEQLNNAEWTQDITIPVPDAVGGYTRGVRLRSKVGNVSLPVQFSIVVDKQLPTIRTATLSGAGEVHVRFVEKVVNQGANDRKEDWYVRWTMVTEGETRVVRTNMETFTTVAEDPFFLRRGTFVGVDESTFQGVDYLRQNDNTPLYEDRAGNYLLDTFTSEP